MSIPIKFTYGGFTVEVDAQQLVEELVGFFNKKKRHVCLLLDFSSTFIQIWFNDITDNFGPVKIARNYDALERNEKMDLNKFMGQSKYVPIASILANNFEELVEGHEHKQEIIKEEEDLNTIKKFLGNIRYFKKFGLDTTQWAFHIHEKGVPVTEVEEWIFNMNDIVNSDIPAISKIRRKIGCNPDEMRDLIQRYNEGKGL